MVRVISQETYNEVVNENIEQFSMTPKEAIEDAVQQFEAQVLQFVYLSFSNLKFREKCQLICCRFYFTLYNLSFRRTAKILSSFSV